MNLKQSRVVRAVRARSTFSETPTGKTRNARALEYSVFSTFRLPGTFGVFADTFRLILHVRDTHATVDPHTRFRRVWTTVAEDPANGRQHRGYSRKCADRFGRKTVFRATERPLKIRRFRGHALPPRLTSHHEHLRAESCDTLYGVRLAIRHTRARPRFACACVLLFYVFACTISLRPPTCRGSLRCRLFVFAFPRDRSRRVANVRENRPRF